MNHDMALKLVKREDKEFERVVFSEVLVPDTLNVFNDHMTKEAVRDFAYEFNRQGYGLDVDHDGVDVAGVKCYVVESFIARPGDPDFVEGAWVIGIKIVDDNLWEDILSGKINGFSYQADVFFTDAEFDDPGVRVIIGLTEPDPYDGHTHEFTVMVGSDNRVISGGTGETDGHSHTISSHTVTAVADNHSHRYQVVGESDNDQ